MSQKPTFPNTNIQFNQVKKYDDPEDESILKPSEEKRPCYDIVYFNNSPETSHKRDIELCQYFLAGHGQFRQHQVVRNSNLIKYLEIKETCGIVFFRNRQYVYHIDGFAFPLFHHYVKKLQTATAEQSPREKRKRALAEEKYEENGCACNIL